jgi:hypothetical protein
VAGLPDWGRAELPAPLPFSFANALRVIGPGAILLATSIGGGEWLVGPAIGVRHGPGLFWIATLAIVLQVLFNLEAIRYTLYTGEPAIAGILRLKPSPRLWAGVWSLLAVVQLGFPALGAACSSVIFAAFAGHVPGTTDAASMRWITYAVMAAAVAILLAGRTIERMLEIASWAMVAFIFTFLTIANLLFVPASHWLATAYGFLKFGYVPAGTDWVMLATLAATAGSGGIGNLVISSWVRDKGFGMGGVVGAIPSAFGTQDIKLSPVGKVFDINAENLRRWKHWWQYVTADQVWLWGIGCFLGMYLNVNLATAIAPPGADLAGVGAGAYQAHYRAERLWSGFWMLALLNGFWILFSTHLGNTDTLVRTVTDIVWASSAGSMKPDAARRIYYTLLAVFTAWGVVGVNSATAMQLFQILGVSAGLVFALSAVQLLMVNTRLLPKELRPAPWRRAALALCAIFYVILFVLSGVLGRK